MAPYYIGIYLSYSTPIVCPSLFISFYFYLLHNHFLLYACAQRLFPILFLIVWALMGVISFSFLLQQSYVSLTLGISWINGCIIFCVMNKNEEESMAVPLNTRLFSFWNYHLCLLLRLVLRLKP